MESNLDFDKKHLWHPYTSMAEPLTCYEVERCEGNYIYLSDGKRLIDGMSSWWAAVHGYNHPQLNKALCEQATKMSHVMFGGLTHAPAVELARRLIKILPAGLDRIFYADSGSVSIEVALKMSLQYQVSVGQTHRRKIGTIRGGYHGDTWHCMSVCDPEGGMHTLWQGGLPEQIFMPRPTTRFDQPWSDENEDAQGLRMFFEKYGEGLAAFILEPVVQGAGGMWFYNPRYVALVRELCDKYGVLMICDEVATGFGRTGRMFGVEWADVVPDIMCVGKALTGGYMTLAAVAANERVALGIDGAFMHGPTFMGNPLACAVACASLDIIIESDFLGRAREIEKILNEGLAELRARADVADIRVLGAIGVVEMHEPVDMGALQRRFVELGIWVRPFGRLVYLMPPFVTPDEDLRTLCRALEQALDS